VTFHKRPLISWVSESVRERNRFGTLEALVLFCFFLPFLFFYLPIGFIGSMVNFTYGARGHEPAFKAMLPQFLLQYFAAAYGLEIIFRGFLLRTLLKKYSWRKAFWLHLAIVNVFCFPFLGGQGSQMMGMGLFRFWLAENILESLWGLFFLRTGSLFATALLHGTYNLGRFVIMNDVDGPYETLYFYSAAADDFYWLILSVLLAGAAVQLLINRRWGMREGKSSEA
jgi:membrane protease YdiL (CAAX protease family)